MKGKLMAGVVVAALWGGAALADDLNRSSSMQSSPSVQSSQDMNNQGLSNPSLNDNSMMAQPAPAPVNQDVNINLPPEKPVKRESNAKMRGLEVEAGAGIEGYTGALAPQIRPGPTYGVSATLRPTKVLGLELGYTGAVNEIGSGSASYLTGYSGGIARGADIVRNGGRALATFGLTAAPVQPYLGAGVGFDHYNVRGSSAAFRDDTLGNVPVAAGLRTHIGHFTADARVGTSFLFDNQFAENVSGRSYLGVNSINATRYQGTITLGSTF